MPKLDKEVRLSDFVPGIFISITSKKGMKNAIKKALIKIDGKQGFTSDYIRGGEIIELYQELEVKNKPRIDIDLEVIFEDDYLAIINKPAGIVVSGNKKWTLENALASNLAPSSQMDALARPEPIHRLDYPTSGALVVGKTIQAVVSLNKLFEERQIDKYYTAVTIGNMNDSGIINTDIGTKTAKTEYRVLNRLFSERFEFLNLVELKPHSGRKHQLRIHLSEMGNPILGDLEHGIEGLILKGKGLYLHASRLHFHHPFTNRELEIASLLPKKFLKLFS